MPPAPPSVFIAVGTRPEAIKLAPVVEALRRLSPAPEVRIMATAQQRELLDQALADFDLRPDYDLDLMRPAQALTASAARILEAVGELLAEHRPALLLVQGDTTTALASALAAFYQGVPVGHVEAGLRTGDPARPFPEEMNRRLVGRLAALHFAATEQAARRLREEGVAPAAISVTGNTVIDSLLAMRTRIEATAAAADDRRKRILVTTHRREHFDGPLEQITGALARLADRNDVEIRLPVHPNPRVRDVLLARLRGRGNVLLSEPVGYRRFVEWMLESRLILTDSGGIQEEAPSLGKPVLVLRNETERPEAVAAGAARVVGTDPDAIIAEAERLLDDEAAYREMAQPRPVYGDGRAAERIAEAVAAFLRPEARAAASGLSS